MTKKNYQKPTVKVVQLQHRHYLLGASDPDTPRTLRGRQKSGSETQDTWYDLQ